MIFSHKEEKEVKQNENTARSSDKNLFFFLTKSFVGGCFVHCTMLLCFGSRRRAGTQHTQWDEGDLLLDDESQMIPNPYFLDTGKRTRHSKLRLSNTKPFIFTAVMWDKTLVL